SCSPSPRCSSPASCSSRARAICRTTSIGPRPPETAGLSAACHLPQDSASLALDRSHMTVVDNTFTKMVFGDLRGMDLAIDPFGLFDKDQTRIRVTERIGIATPVGTYFSYLKGLKNTL